MRGSGTAATGCSTATCSTTHARRTWSYPCRRQRAISLRSAGRVLCVLRAEDVALLRRDGLRLERLGEVRYLNTGNLNLRTLLDPDPERYLQHVVLVANR